MQLRVHLKKWTLKFKLLYLRNYISYFNKIGSICCVNTHIQSLKVWLKSVLSLLKYSIFSKDCFLLAHPVFTFRNFFFLYFFYYEQSYLVSIGSIFTIFSPNGRYLREFSRSLSVFPIPQGTFPWQPVLWKNYKLRTSVALAFRSGMG